MVHDLVLKINEYLKELPVEERSEALDQLVCEAVRDLDGIEWIEIY